MSTLSRVATGLAAAGLFAAAMWIQTYEVPLKHAATAPLGPTGHVGETVGNRIFSLKVDKYEVARSVRSKGSLGISRPPVQTNQLFLILYVQVKGNREPLSVSGPKLVTKDGLSYRESSRIESSGGLFRLYQPQLWYRTVMPFEFPKDKLEGARLVVDDTKIINLLPAKVEIDLGIDKQKADQLRARPRESYEVKTS